MENLFNNHKLILVDDRFLYSHDLYVWFEGDHVRRNRMLFTLNDQRVNPFTPKISSVILLTVCHTIPGHEIAPNTGANATKFFILVTKSWKLVAKLATRIFHHNLTKRSSELKRFAKTNPRQTSSLSLFPKCSTCISINN